MKIHYLNIYADFLAYYTLVNKSNETSQYQPDELDDNLIENNRQWSSYPLKIKEIISGETMQCCKVRQILQYHMLNKLVFP